MLKQEEVKKQVKEITIGGKIYKFQENLRGIEILASMEEGAQKEAMKTTVRLICKACQEPKLSYKEILMLPYLEFIELIKGFSKVYGVPGELGFLEPK